MTTPNGNAGARTVDALGEWELRPPITLAHWQVRMVLQALGMCFDDYHRDSPARSLPAVHSIVQEDIIALLLATINDIAEQAGLVTVSDTATVSPTRVFAAGSSAA